MRFFEQRPYRDPSPTRVHVLMGIAGAGLLLLTALSVTSVTRDKLTEAHLIERARSAGGAAGKVAGKAEVKAQVQGKVEAEVSDQLGHALYPNLYPPTTLPPEAQPIDPVDPSVTTTTEPEPFDLTTTTTAEPFDLTTTTTIEVPTTLPDLPPLP